VSAAQLVPILRPLIPQYGHLAAYTAANILIISDRANNVSRMMRIIERIDQGGDDAIDIIPLQNASSAEIVRVVNTLAAGAAAGGEAAGPPVKVVADGRTNSVLITGEKSQRLRLKALIAHLDTPLESGGDTQVRYLRYADAEKLAKSLKEQIQGLTAAGAPGGNAAAAASADKSVMLWADTQNNALVLTAPPKIMRQIMSIVDKLDIRRPQVKVEAILVEMSAEKTSELGFNWVVGPVDSSGSVVPIGIFNQPIGGTSIGSIAGAALAATTGTTTATSATASQLASAIPTGATLGAGRIPSSGTAFVGLLRALRGDAHTNIISTPSIITLDNEEAKIEVAQEVPFITGQYASTGASSTSTSGVVNPFQTIQRQEVGNILKITPQINEDESVLLKIDQEASSLAQGTQGAVDLITNKRTISTKVMVEDGGIIVMGGLIEENLTEGENRVPVLGSIPLLGQLFKTRNVDKKKTNLMVFIRPTIMRDAVQTAIATNAKYNLMRDAQRSYRNGKVTLLPGEKQPQLPPIEDLSKYADPTGGAHPPTKDTDPSAIERPPPVPGGSIGDRTPAARARSNTSTGAFTHANRALRAEPGAASRL
jgi:general secretion pathway protein D